MNSNIRVSIVAVMLMPRNPAGSHQRRASVDDRGPTVSEASPRAPAVVSPLLRLNFSLLVSQSRTHHMI